MPIGFGRAGERVAKIPCGPSSRNGVTVSLWAGILCRW